MSGLANVTTEELRGVQVVRISGEIDDSNASDIRDRLVRAVSNQEHGVVLDISQAGYFDSSGVQLLFEVADRLKQRGQQLRVVVTSDSFVAKVLRVVRLEDVVSIDASVSDAVATLAK